MVVKEDGGVIRLEGNCTIEEAEDLHRWLGEQPGAQVDLRPCTHLHAALLQLLLVWRPRVMLPEDARLRGVLAPALTAGSKPPMME